ncbi:MAG: class I SAM-dependent methyltransferase, partial [Mariprofundaceae bacterium]
CRGETNWALHTRLPAFIFGIRAEILRCRECGLGRTLPPPDTSELFYEENTRYDKLFSSRHDLYNKFAVLLLSALDGLVKASGKSLLDVGCGGGFLVEAAQEMGFRAEGIEANNNLVKWCKSRNLQVHEGDVSILEATGERYDIIVLSAILEHVFEPQLLLMTCKKLLSPDGIILISQASYDGLLPKVFPWAWYGWQPKEHFWHFTPDSLRRLVNSIDLSVVYERRNSLYHPWFLRGGITEIIGRNVAALVARVGVVFRSGDEFCVAIKK